MSYIPNIEALTSEIGVNSYTATTGSLWTGNVFVGAGEQNNFNYVGVNLQTDESGTLTFEFSQNGTDWTLYPTQEFTIVGGINEIHGAWKGTRYVRPKYTGSNGSRTYFRISTMYSYDPIILTAPLNQPISSDSDANIVRAVAIGANPSGNFVNQKIDGVGFSTTSNITSGSTFESSVLDAQGYTQVQTSVISSNDGTLGFKFCSTSNCSGTTVGQNGVERYLLIPYLSTDGFVLYSAPAFTPYVQYSFTNNGTGTTTHFYYETKLLTKSLSGQLLGMESFISPYMVANLGRNIIVGRKANGDFTNVPVDESGHILVHINDPKTAFGEIRMSEMTPQIQTSFVYGINLSLITTGITGSGSVTSSDSMIVVQTGAGSNSSGEITTIKPVKYNPGQGSLVRFTGIYTLGVSGNTQWIGPLDDEDGFAFGYSGTSFGILRRQNSVDYFIPQTQWNLDVMDGSSSIYNPSAQLLDPTKGNVYEIKFQYLGFGNIVYSLERSVSGEFVPVHMVRYANSNTIPSVYNPTTPIKVISENTTNTTNVVLKSASISGFVEGKRELIGPVRSFTNSKNPNTSEHTFSIRNKSTFKGKNNKVRIYIQFFNASSRAVGASGDPVALSILKNPTFGSVLTWSDINTDSVVEQSTTDSTVSGGETILTLGLASSDSTSFSVPDKFLYEIEPGTIVTFKATGNNSGFSAGLTWVEDF